MKIATKNSSPIKGEGNELHFHALAVGLMAMDNCLEFCLPSPKRLRAGRCFGFIIYPNVAKKTI